MYNEFKFYDVIPHSNKGDNMRKNGFTLAEILIVLTIIGVMAVMTIPSLIQNSNSQQKIVLFKKAFNAASNAISTEFATKTPPKSYKERHLVFDALAKQLNVKYFYRREQENEEAAKVFQPPELLPEVTPEYWIVTEDGIGYRVSYEGGSDCISKLKINSKNNTHSGLVITCSFVEVDIDGPENGLNIICDDNTDLTNLNCDRIKLAVANNAQVTAGNPDCTIAGRIMSDNTTYDENKCK